uniref:DUF3168 domain-containing protein n=1 Tax=Thermosporothrix sp. COM3 TaxID=2490863 RepID=A0A455SST8_9CHLR|nr:hypothetical protein KTC_48900 [Thermosporothrix sp. COM3]BBH90204.1 hypothetical protein KTC_49550 [Thermosporothrix sp. COM3]BBH90269.1 hypothetical protein KTC_50200 [Thermosporothrix sp. COM3]
MTSLGEIQRALYQRLTGDTTLMNLVKGIFDASSVPDVQTYPYVTIGEATEVPFHSFQRRGYEATVTLHIWSAAKGFKEAQAILARLNQILDQQSLQLATMTQVGCWYEFSESLNDPEEDVRHMPVRYRIETQE